MPLANHLPALPRIRHLIHISRLTLLIPPAPRPDRPGPDPLPPDRPQIRTRHAHQPLRHPPHHPVRHHPPRRSVRRRGSDGPPLRRLGRSPLPRSPHPPSLSPLVRHRGRSGHPEPGPVREAVRPIDTPARGEPPRTALPCQDGVCPPYSRRPLRAGRQEYGGMRFPWQGLHVLEASAPSAGVCHRCAAIAQVPATRSAAERWHRRDGGAPWHAPELRTLARSRGPAPLGRGQAPTGPSPTPSTCPALLCDPLHRPPIGRVRVRDRSTASPIPSRFFATVGIPRKSPLCRHTLTYFSAVLRDRSLVPSGRPRPAPAVAVLRPRRPLPTAVRRRSLPDRYRSGPHCPPDSEQVP